jgi:uncharacterized protein
MKIVSDTGPIIGLAKIGKIDLLKSIAEEVLIPPMVYRELFGRFGRESDQIDLALSDFIQIKSDLKSDLATERVLADLDEGEKQAISLAFTIGKDVLLLLDDRAGRQAAKKLNIPTTGLVGLLLLAKEKGIAKDIGFFIDELRDNGYWLSDEIVSIAKKLAGE